MSAGRRQEVAEAVRDALEGPCGVADGTPLVAACSGGADSVALVHALGAWRARWPLVAVVFVDHGLRDVGGEAAAAREAAEREGVAFRCEAVTLPAGGNVQANARRARYAALESAAGAGALVATGHTRTDQAETVLQRIVRGSGLRGLAAIRPREGRWVRPMLKVPRAATRGLGWPYVDDPTNGTDRFLRNRLREDIVPRLAVENPQIEEALSALAHAAGEEISLVDALLDLLDLKGLDLTGARPDLVEVIARWRHRRELSPLPPPSRASMEALARLTVQGGRVAAVSLGQGVRGRADRGRVSFVNDEDSRFVLVAPGFGTYCLGDRALTVSRGPLITPPDTIPRGASLQMLMNPSAVTWPMRLGPAPAIAPDGGLRGGGPALTLVDGVGQILWETGELNARPPVLGHGPDAVHVKIEAPLVEIEGPGGVLSKTETMA